MAVQQMESVMTGTIVRRFSVNSLIEMKQLLEGVKRGLFFLKEELL